MASTSQANGIAAYNAPTTLEDAVQILAAGSATILAGGTDLMVQTEADRIAFEQRLINIRRIDTLRGVSEWDGHIRVGALTTMTELARDPLIAAKVPLIATMVDRFASNQIRNAATIGGNICNASPAGDSIQPLLVLDAVVELASWTGRGVAMRTVPIADFFTGPGKTVRQQNELVVGVSLPAPAAGFLGFFAKSGPRPALEISTVSAAFGAVKANGALTRVRLSFGAVAPTPIRARQTEAFLEGKTLDDDTIAAASEIALEDVSPIDDVRASAWYRNHLIRVFTRRLLSDAADG